MTNELPKAYDPKTVEGPVAKRWEQKGFGNPDKLPERHKTPFVTMMPPPNVTGALHIGHALEASMTDCLVRFKRMQGFKTLYLPGLDHAGIATQNAVEKMLRKEGKSRFDLGREAFVERVQEWKKDYGGKILKQFRRMGVSVDWSRERYTMDDKYIKAVETAFLHYHKKGWIYKGTRVINWCTRCSTSISDLEVNHVTEKAKLYYIRYGSFILATVRPETKLGDTALAVHPEDPRYKDHIGKKLTIESVDNELAPETPPRSKKITIQVVGDDVVDPDFGTGIIKVTPAHDLTDFDIGQRHDLPSIQVIDERGKMNEQAGQRFAGIKVNDAREKIVADLEALGLMEHIEEYEHNIARCERCNTVVEPLPSQQWFLKMSELAKAAADAFQSEKVRIQPEQWLRVTLERLEKERDWCISRQLWWGHRLPVWNCQTGKNEKGKMKKENISDFVVAFEKPAVCPRCNKCVPKREDDVLDTWFSSALWPFATLGWPFDFAQGKPKKGSDLEKYYPTQWMTSAREILFLWINRMVFSGLEFMDKAPFTDVFIHPTLLTKDGKRMSKSLGTGIDPMELIERFGADAVRFGLLWQVTGVQDIRFDESAVVAGKKFLNKLWNASRFVLAKTGGQTVPDEAPEPQTDEDKAVLQQLRVALATLEQELEVLRFGQALERFYNFFWHEFCDQYLEHAKVRKDETARSILLWTLSCSLRALCPFVPFITEELWDKMPHTTRVPLMIAHWPNTSQKIQSSNAK